MMATEKVTENSSKAETKTFRVSQFRCSPHLYLKIQVTLEDENEKWSPKGFKFIVQDALKETLGLTGLAINVDVLKLWSEEGTAIIRVPTEKAESIWAALSLYGKTPKGKHCAFTVENSSPFLMTLSLGLTGKN